MAQVPNTTTFKLTDVTAVVGGTSLSQAFANANAAYFDPTYGGTCTCLLNFRNYTEVTTFTITVDTTFSGGGDGACGSWYIRCCTGSYYHGEYIEVSPYGNVCIDVLNVPDGCYFVDFTDVCSYLAGVPIPSSYYWGDSYGYGYTCCTNCFPGGTNNYVTMNVSDSY